MACLSLSDRAEVLRDITPAQAKALLTDWRGFNGRPNQIAPPGDWGIWVALSGRGYGKTEAGAQWVREQEAAGVKSIALIAETQKDLEEVMVARLLSIYPENERPHVRYKPVRITWPSGCVALGYNGTEPNQLRGPEFEAAWIDELAKYRYAQQTWDMLQFCMRVGDHPKQFITTTPRNIPIIKELVGRAARGDGVVVTRGKTADNASNLSPAFLAEMDKKYAGTRMGRQELFAEILDDIPGALWTRRGLDENRRADVPKMRRILVAVDPAVTSGEDADDHGIIVGGLGDDGRGYVLADGTCHGTPDRWARQAIALYDQYEADAIVVEVNQGGEMVAMTLRSVRKNIRIIEVTASRGKHVRAEPIAALYEQGKISHIGSFADLEDQMMMITTHGFQGENSPDRADAMVWLFSALFDLIKPSGPRPGANFRAPIINMVV